MTWVDAPPLKGKSRLQCLGAWPRWRVGTVLAVPFVLLPARGALKHGVCLARQVDHHAFCRMPRRPWGPICCVPST